MFFLLDFSPAGIFDVLPFYIVEWKKFFILNYHKARTCLETPSEHSLNLANISKFSCFRVMEIKFDKEERSLE